MHERRPLKSMRGPFAPEKGLGQTTQVLVNLRHHLANRTSIVALGVISITLKTRSRRGGRRALLAVNRCHN
jgi:hypothetical protein